MPSFSSRPAALLHSVCAVTALFLLALPAQARDPASAEVDAVGKSVLKKTAWVNEANTCPVQVMQARPAAATKEDESCYGTPSAACMARCESGVADACYWLGQGMEQAHALALVYQTLYQCACKLGNASACTNRGADILPDTGKTDAKATDCALHTFEKTCAQDDPWGCTMLGMHLVKGMGTAPDPQRALEVMRGACRLGVSDPACVRAQELRVEAQQMLKGQAPKK